MRKSKRERKYIHAEHERRRKRNKRRRSIPIYGTNAEKLAIADNPYIKDRPLSKIIARGWYKYEDYIVSEKWEKRRTNYWKKHDRVCYCCGEFALDLHHCTYAHLGHEWDCDLIPTCRDCHKGIHKLVKGNKAGLRIAHSTYKSLINK